MDIKVNSVLAIALGWKKEANGNWLSPQGSIQALPDFCGNAHQAEIVVKHFLRRPSFRKYYRQDMTPAEICDLALKN